MEKFEVKEWIKNQKYYISNWSNYLWQDGKLHDHVDGIGKGFWASELGAMNFLHYYEEKQMSENTIKLNQVTQDIELLQQEQATLIKKVEDEKEYIFKEGDVVRNMRDLGKPIRFVGRFEGKLVTMNKDGYVYYKTQDNMEHYRYKKIGVLKDFLS